MRKASSTALTSLFASYGSDSDNEDGEIRETSAEGEGEEEKEEEENDAGNETLGRSGIVMAYGGEEPGNSSPTSETNAQETPTASTSGPEVPLGDGHESMPMPSVDVGVTEEEDHSFNLALRIFPDVELPPPPEAECKEELQAKIVKYLELKAQGRSINSELRKSKGYRNPDFLQKIVKHFDIKEQWSHFPTNVFDPTGYPPDDYFDKLVMTDSKPKAGAKREFVSAGPQGGVSAAQRPPVTRVEGVKPMVGVAGLPTTAASAAVMQQQALAQIAAVQATAAQQASKKSKWDH